MSSGASRGQPGQARQLPPRASGSRRPVNPARARQRLGSDGEERRLGRRSTRSRLTSQPIQTPAPPRSPRRIDVCHSTPRTACPGEGRGGQNQGPKSPVPSRPYLSSRSPARVWVSVGRRATRTRPPTRTSGSPEPLASAGGRKRNNRFSIISRGSTSWPVERVEHLQVPIEQLHGTPVRLRGRTRPSRTCSNRAHNQTAREADATAQRAPRSASAVDRPILSTATLTDARWKSCSVTDRRHAPGRCSCQAPNRLVLTSA